MHDALMMLLYRSFAGASIASWCTDHWIGGASWLIIHVTFSSRTIHNIFLVSLIPVDMTRPWCHTVQSILMKVISYPTLQSRTTNSGEYAESLGMMWHRCPRAGNCGSARLQICMDCTYDPFGSLIYRGSFVGLTLDVAAPVIKK